VSSGQNGLACLSLDDWLEADHPPPKPVLDQPVEERPGGDLSENSGRSLARRGEMLAQCQRFQGVPPILDWSLPLIGSNERGPAG
jgi:hypothetical protein